MECNKEEAIRAMDIAKRKVTENDYNGAKTFANKAMNLYPQLVGLKQVLMMIDVFISAGNKVIGGESDWYGVLGVDPLAEDEVVKKQYKKLALLLHPDKNKCEGAEDAFKIVLQAWSLLSDKVKRIAFDQKRNLKVVKPRKSRKQKQPPAPNTQKQEVPNKKQQSATKQKQTSNQNQEPANPQKQQAPNKKYQVPRQKQQAAKQEPPNQEEQRPANAQNQKEKAPKKKQPPAAKKQKQPPKQKQQTTNQPEQPPNQPEQSSNQPEQSPNQPEQPPNKPKQPPNQPEQSSNQEQQQPGNQQEQQQPLSKLQKQQAAKQPPNQQEQAPKQEQIPPNQPEQAAKQQPPNQEQAAKQEQIPPNQPKQQSKQPSSSGVQKGRAKSKKPPTSKVGTFLTMCTNCTTEHEYVRGFYLNKTVICQNCRGSFMATEKENAPQETNVTSRQPEEEKVFKKRRTEARSGIKV